jgi:cytochrome oxidase Cu insertion factor (SCO1/SenC/PrrC family)
MGGSLGSNNPVIVAAFHTALRHQALIAVLLGLIVIFTSSAARPGRYLESPTTAETPRLAEHPARRLLRLSFGIIWIFDGLLQLQPAMPIGMPSQVVQPAAATSPAWVQHLVNDGLTIWNRHPIPAASAAVWIQIGIGVLLIFSPPGRLSRFAGLVSIGWGLVVWIFGEAFGGIFAPGLTWMFGAPGAVLFYCLAGLLIALPERAWVGRRLGHIVLGVLGVFFIGMAVLQAWPGRGFWQGQAEPSATAGGLTSMVQTMAQTPQPHLLSSLVNSFASFDAAHGWAVNLFVVVALALVGAGFLSRRPGLIRTAVVCGGVVCLADWILVQDLGFFGGVGTDPNSMIPLTLVCVAGYLAVVREPAMIALPVDVPEPQHSPLPGDAQRPETIGDKPPWLLRPGVSRGLAVAATLAALGIVLVGAVPLASASVDSHTDAILSEGINGQPDITNAPAAPFNLVDQNGAPVTLSSFRGRTVALTFLDPVCTTDCPVIAQEFRLVDQRLGPAAARNTAFVAIVANPIYRTVAAVQAFDRQENLNSLSNWYYLTGSVAELRSAWGAYGVQVQTVSAGSMVAHTDNAFVIDANGRLRAVMGADPGSGSATSASLATMLQQQMLAVMHQ